MMASDTPISKQRFTSRWGMLLAVLGMAVGTGNIWRFPRIAATNSGDDGAGAFLIAWLVFLFVWSIPLIIAEYALGRKGRLGVIGTFTKLAGDRYSWMGAFCVFVAAAILFYYTVVAGWCFFYLGRMVFQGPDLSIAAAQGAWDGFQSSYFPVLFHALAVGLGSWAVWKGVRGIERVNKVLVPALLVIVVIALFRTFFLEGAGEGLAFLFTPDWSTLSYPKLWLEALTQNAWDTGAGWGLVLTYGAYMQSRHGVVQNAVITGAGNNTVSLFAGMIIFGTVFAILGTEMSRPEVLEIMQSSGPAATGLTFIWMPQLFATMPGGHVFAILFFLGLSCAALSSLISMIEIVVRSVIDFGVNRSHAIIGVSLAVLVLGIPSAINLGFFENQDFVWGLALIISGAFMAFVVIRQGARSFREKEIDNLSSDWSCGRSWDIMMNYIVPVLACALLGWWLWLSGTVYAPDTWYNPLDTFSLMTCIAQWGAVIGILLVLNRMISKRILSINQ
ncbi:MAG: sodium-dependent transporter [Bacteroidetes bacterium]|nr:sodium-dependent transporter [Bacteroidota bacterium]